MLPIKMMKIIRNLISLTHPHGKSIILFQFNVSPFASKQNIALNPNPNAAFGNRIDNK